MKVDWSVPARRDLSRIQRYIAKVNPQAARRIAKAILSAAQQLEQFPNSGPMTEQPGLRLLQVVGLPYVLVYRAIDDIEIVKVFDQRRNPEDLI